MMHTPNKQFARSGYKASYLANVLRAIQSCRQLLGKEDDIRHVLQYVCDLLASSPGVFKAQIKLIDESGILVTIADAQGAQETEGSEAEAHTTNAWLEYADNTYGVLSVNLRHDLTADDDEGFLPELGSHLAASLYTVQLNITRKRTEKALQATTYRYREIGDSITDLFFALDKTFRCTYWNSAAENLTGIPSSEALGQPLLQLFPDISGSDAEQEYALAVQEQRPRSFIQTYRHNGKLVYFEVNIYPSSDDFSILAKDVTYRKQMEDALKKSWDYLENLNNSLGDAIFTVNMPDQQIEYVNRAVENVFGYSIDECIGQNIRMFFQDDAHHAEFSRQLHAAFDQQQEIVRLEHMVCKKSGELFTAEITNTFLQDNGELSGVISIVRDVTERKAMQLALEQERMSLARKVRERTAELQSTNAQLARASKLKDEFLARMSHELRTPLNAILGYARMLQKGQNLAPLQSEGLETIESSGEHLLHLINDILDLSKIEAGRMELHPTAFHLTEFLEQIAKMMRVRAEHKHIEFTFESDPLLPAGVYADEKRVREVLINLLDNAVKFTDAGFVKLTVSSVNRDEYTSTFTINAIDFSDAACAEPVEAPGNTTFDELSANDKSHNSTPLPPTSPYAMHTIRFEVEDTGAGIAPEQLELIFLPFQQVGQNRYVQEGTGLGLAITQQLVKVMGSALHVESIEQEGSIFWFDLNLPEAAGIIPKPQRQSPEVIGYKGPPRKILVTDDLRENRALITNMLLPIGFEILEAENGEQCLELACREKPDVILLDLLMPVMDGFESARRIRSTPSIQHIPLIAISASVFEDTVTKSLAAGCNTFLFKPLELETLLECLQAQIQVEWLYQAEPQRAPDSAQALDVSQDTATAGVFSVEQRQELRKWAQCGNITRLLEQLSQLETLNEAYRPLVTEFRKYTKSFQLQYILADLDRMEAMSS